MIIIGCGSRDGQVHGLEWVWAQLDAINKQHRIDAVITGQGGKTDAIIDGWAQARQLDRILVPANWAARGKPAGPYRNRLMLDILDRLAKPGEGRALVAFPGGIGTQDMVRAAQERGVEIIKVMP